MDAAPPGTEFSSRGLAETIGTTRHAVDNAIHCSGRLVETGEVLSPDHAPLDPFLHVRASRARRRPVRPDRCAATLSATRLGLICLAGRRIGARSPTAHPVDGARRSMSLAPKNARSPRECGNETNAAWKGGIPSPLFDADDAGEAAASGAAPCRRPLVLCLKKSARLAAAGPGLRYRPTLGYFRS
jgi:hypothetical protein